MLRLLPFPVTSALLLAVCLTYAKAQSSPADISITVSNRSDVELSLRLVAAPGVPLPPSLAPAVSPHGSAAPASPAQPFGLQRAVKPGQASILAIKPGQYRLQANSAPSAAGMARPLNGFVSATNAEVWIFDLARKEQGLKLPYGEWDMRVPTRPEFRLSSLPESPRLPLPQRNQRQNSSTPPGLALPVRTLKLPESSSSK